MSHAPVLDPIPADASLPPRFRAWFEARGWALRAHQAAALDAHRKGEHALLIAPTGGGKTLAGFLPSLVELSETNGRGGLHTLYLSPLKALTTDIARNLDAPIAEIGLDIRCETRTGDTPSNRRARQRVSPPDILLTTPESLALLLADSTAGHLFGGLRRIVIDEAHALAGTKRGDLMALGLSRLWGLAPAARTIGLSATVARPTELMALLSPHGQPCRLIEGQGGAAPDIRLLVPEARMPWAGHIALYALADVYQEIKRHGMTLVFVNTRAAAELCFQTLWRLNEDGLPIGLHHGSLDVEQRRRTEAAMASGKLRAVVCTSSLDLGIDWGGVDLVVQIGAPKGTARLMQRIGRANHRLEQPSKAMLVPGNRFEILECLTAIEAIGEGEIDGDAPRPGGLDVLAQHLIGIACAGPFDADLVYRDVSAVGPYRALSRSDFDAVLDFVATGGYALQSYERFRRIVKGIDGLYRLKDRRLAQSWKMNVGVIVEAPTLTVQFRGRGGVLGKIEEHFVQWLSPGDTFLFAGRLLRFEGIRETVCEVSPGKGPADPKVPAYVGGRLPLSTNLADRVRGLLADPKHWHALPGPARDWLRIQALRSRLPGADELLIETFPRGERHYMVAYAFAGRNAHQTLGMLLTRRMERAGLKPMGFVASDYVIATWSLEPVIDPEPLFTVDMLGDDLEEWMAESSMLKRTFRNVAVIAGLIERKHPGSSKTGRQVTINSDLIYDVLRKYQPDHVLLRATWADAAGGLTDIRRLSDLLARVQGHVRHVVADRITPLALPTLLEIGRESVFGPTVEDMLLDEITDELVREAGLEGDLAGTVS